MFSLIWGALGRRKARTVFTFLSIVAAFMLFSVLATIRQGVVGQLGGVSASSLNTYNRTVQGGLMPLDYANRIARVPGVVAVSALREIPGTYVRSPAQPVTVFAAQSESIFNVFADYRPSPGVLQAFKNDPQGAIAGPALARRMGWKIGDDIIIHSNPLRRDDHTTWRFRLNGIYAARVPSHYQSFLVVHYGHVNAALPAVQRNQVSQIVERINDPRRSAEISRAIDALFAADPVQTLTQSQEAEMMANIRQFGNVSLLVLAVGATVFFTLLLIVCNSLYQSAQERLTEFAVLRALGFRSRRLVWLLLGEALALNLSGAAAGLLGGYWLTQLMHAAVASVLWAFDLTLTAVFTGLGIAFVISLVAAGIPLPRVLGIRVPEMLRGV